MDPNAVLDQLREALAQRDECETVEAANELAHQAADSAESLIEWLAAGGFARTGRRCDCGPATVSDSVHSRGAVAAGGQVHGRGGGLQSPSCAAGSRTHVDGWVSRGVGD